MKNCPPLLIRVLADTQVTDILKAPNCLKAVSQYRITQQAIGLIQNTQTNLKAVHSCNFERFATSCPHSLGFTAVPILISQTAEIHYRELQ